MNERNEPLCTNCGKPKIKCACPQLPQTPEAENETSPEQTASNQGINASVRHVEEADERKHDLPAEEILPATPPLSLESMESEIDEVIREMEEMTPELELQQAMREMGRIAPGKFPDILIPSWLIGARRLESEVAGMTPLMHAAAGGCLTAIKVLLEKGAKAHACDSEGRTVLMHTIMGGSPTAVKMLLDYDMLWDRTEKRITVETAAKKGDPKILKLILANIHDLDVRTASLSNALIQLAKEGNANGIRLLVAEGADVNALNYKGQTALECATLNQHIEAAHVLRLAHGIKADIPDHNRSPSALTLAATKPSIATLLEDNGGPQNSSASNQNSATSAKGAVPIPPIAEIQSAAFLPPPRGPQNQATASQNQTAVVQNHLAPGGT